MATADAKKGAQAKKGQMTLPDMSEFNQQPNDPQVGTPPVGRVEGMDYTMWAVALLDLADSPNRIERNRIRIAGKGYRKVEGNPLVGGFDRCEVWVMPRANYAQNRAARLRKIEAAIDAGTMTDSATRKGTITKSR